MAFGDLRQGHPTSAKVDWRAHKLTQSNLPHTIQMGQEFGFKRETNVTVIEEILWQEEMTRLIILAFLPNTYKIATDCMNLIGEHATGLVAKEVEEVTNPLIGGKLSKYSIKPPLALASN